MRDLERTQRRFARLVTAPEGVAAALRADGDPAGTSLDAWLRGDGRASAQRRLEIHAGGFFQRIHAVLEADFGALAQALGADGFHDLVTAYLIAHPPHRPSLRDAGAALPGFLAEARGAAPFRRRWPFAADLARLEWALQEAFDAADGAPLTRASLASLSPERWASLGFAWQPSVALLPVSRDAIARRRAHDDGAALRPVRGAASVSGAGAGRRPVLVWRRGERVRWREIAARESVALRRVAGGATFGALCDGCARLEGEAAAARVASWLGSWVDAGLLRWP